MFYIVFIVGILLSLLNDKKQVSAKILAFILFILAIFRYGIGPDYFAYRYLYARLQDSVIDELRYGLDDQEIGFRLIGSLMKSFSVSYQVYLGLFALISIYFMYKLCKKYSSKPTLSLLIYFSFYYFVWTFSGIRQGITIVIGVYYLLECIETKKIFKFTLIVFGLSLIHASALFLLVLYMASKAKLQKNKLILLAIFCIIFASLPIGEFVIRFFQFVPLFDRLLPYVESGSVVTNVFDFQSIGRVVFLVITILYYDAYSKQDKISSKIITIYIISILFYFVFKFSESAAARLSIYGRVLDVIILANLYNLYKTKFDKMFYSFFLSGILVLYLLKELNSMEENSGLVHRNRVTPYVIIYNNEKVIFLEQIHFVTEE